MTGAARASAAELVHFDHGTSRSGAMLGLGPWRLVLNLRLCSQKFGLVGCLTSSLGLAYNHQPL